MAKQLLHLVFGGELSSLDKVEFRDLSKTHFVGLYPNYAKARDAWKAAAQATVDNAHMRYFVVHLHRPARPRARRRPRRTMARKSPPKKRSTTARGKPRKPAEPSNHLNAGVVVKPVGRVIVLSSSNERGRAAKTGVAETVLADISTTGFEQRAADVASCARFHASVSRRRSR